MFGRFRMSLICFLLQLISIGSVLPTSAAEPPHKKIDGCFVQLTKDDNEIDQSHWTDMLNDIRRLNFNTIIIQRLKFKDGETIQDYQKAALHIFDAVKANNDAALKKNSAATKIGVLVGTYMPNNDEWSYSTPAAETEVLNKSLADFRDKGKNAAHDFWGALKTRENDPKTKGEKDLLTGWYIPLETWNFEVAGILAKHPDNFKMIHDFIQGSVSDLKSINQVPVSLSCFANPWLNAAYASPSSNGDLYAYTLFKNTGLDELIFQDSFGAKILGEDIVRPPNSLSVNDAEKSMLILFNYMMGGASINHIARSIDMEAFQAGKNDPARTSEQPNADPNSAPFVPTTTTRFAKQLNFMQQRANEPLRKLSKVYIFDYNHYLGVSKELNDQVSKWQGVAP